MKLLGTKNQTVELKIIEAKSTATDSDWLKVYLNVKSEFGNWEVVDESLMLSEFKELISWFKDLSENKEIKYKNLYFTEPNLEFFLVENNNSSKKIRMIFSAESKPKSAKQDDQIFVDFDFSNDDLAKISSDLEKELTIVG